MSHISPARRRALCATPDRIRAWHADTEAEKAAARAKIAAEQMMPTPPAEPAEQSQ